MKRIIRAGARAALAGLLVLVAPVAANAQTKPQPIEIKGEVIDTWCYLSGVMGGQDAIVGSSHHTCAWWCSAGGNPVGVRAEDGTVYLVRKRKGEDPLEQSDTVMEIQSHTITARGQHYVRDGVNYLVVEKVVADAGIVNPTLEEYGPVPPFVIPEKK